MKRGLPWLFPLGAVATLLSFPFPPPVVNLSIAVAIVTLLVFAGLWFGAPHGLGSAIPSIPRVAWSLLIGVVRCGDPRGDHLPFVHRVAPEPLDVVWPGVIAAVLFVNGLAATVLGLVYVKWGVEAAMCTHFAADVTAHVIGPYLFA